MGFVVHHSIFFAHYYLQPPYLLPSPRNTHFRRKNRVVTACLQKENPRNVDFCKRRAILYMGFAAIPLLNFRAEAVEGLVAGNTEINTLDQKQEAESVKGNSHSNPFLSLLNALGFLGSGVLAALYADLQKEKATSDATIDSINAKLKEKESAITSLSKKFESNLLNEKEAKTKAVAKASEEKQSLINQLEAANGTIRSLGQDLQKEKKLVDKKTIELENLEITLRKAQDEKRELQDLLEEKIDSVAVLQERVNLLSLEINDKEDNLKRVNSKLAEKDRELKQMGSAYQQAEDRLSGLKSEVEELKDVIVAKEKELDLKNLTLDNLNADLISSRDEIDESRKKFDVLLEEYDQFKFNVEKNAELESKILGEKEEELHQVEGKLKVALGDVKNKEALISDLENEKESLSERLSVELKNVQSLENELRVAEGNLEKSRDEATDMATRLEETRSVCLVIESELAKIQNEFKENRVSLEREINEAKRGAEVLNGELMSAKELLVRTNEELRMMSLEFSAAVQKCGGLEEELNDANMRAESAARVLEDEKKIVSSLKKDLKDLETQIAKEKEARKNLESDLEESTKSLDQMNQSTAILSRDLELANSWVSGLRDERDVFLQALDEEKRFSREARENLEDAEKMVMTLGKERGSLENRRKKLEEELASAKGEILRLKSQLNSLKTQVSNPDEKKESAPSRVNSSKDPVNERKESSPSRVNSSENPVNDEKKKEVEEGRKSGSVTTKRATRRRKT